MLEAQLLRRVSGSEQSIVYLALLYRPCFLTCMQKGFRALWYPNIIDSAKIRTWLKASKLGVIAATSSEPRETESGRRKARMRLLKVLALSVLATLTSDLFCQPEGNLAT